MGNPLRFLDLNDVKVPSIKYDILDKTIAVHQYVNYMLDRTSKMFEWKNLPPTIPSRTLELYLQICGHAAFLEVKEQIPIPFPQSRTYPPGIYVFFGGIGGERDIYYRPTTFIAANPRLKQSINCPIIYDKSDIPSQLDNPCVVMRNDTNYMSLVPLFSRYASQMVENDISIHSAQINARAQVGISVNNDAEAETARKYLDALEAGKLAVIGQSAFLDGITVSNVGTQSANVIIQLIELQQYLKASWYNELGLNANFNMKREYLSKEEIASETDTLLPLVDDMLDSRREAAELINELFNLNISVDKNSAWADKDQTILNSLSTGAVEGQIPLTGSVAELLADREKEASIQLEGDDSDGETGGLEETGDKIDRGSEEKSNISDSDSREEEEQQVQTEGQKVIPEVNVNINVNMEGGETDAGEAHEESAESDD